MNSPAALDSRDLATKRITLERKKQTNRADEDLQSLTLDDFMIEPQVDDLGIGQFRAGGDLWTEVDQQKTKVYDVFARKQVKIYLTFICHSGKLTVLGLIRTYYGYFDARNDQG